MTEPFSCPAPWPLGGRRVSLATGLDTDGFGTFSGERPRPADAPETCRRKAEAGMDHTGLDLGLASEGSFGAHPAFPWLPVGSEWLTIVDRGEGLVIAESLLVPRTNFDRRVGFPSHGLIASPHLGEGSDGSVDVPLTKGIRTSGELVRALGRCAGASSDGLVWLETDLRAHCNPTRREAIRTLAFCLVRRIASPCPGCGAPGWGLCEGLAGLPCGWCGQPTKRLRAEAWGCVACDHREEKPRADGRRAADPGDCSWCNP